MAQIYQKVSCICAALYFKFTVNWLQLRSAVGLTYIQLAVLFSMQMIEFKCLHFLWMKIIQTFKLKDIISMCPNVVAN
jgi:hypothetical protein